MSDWKKIEALLFASGRYLSEDQIIEMTGIPKNKLKKAINDLIKHYESIDTSLKIFQEDGFWKMNPKEDFSDIVQKVVSEAELPRPVMETLAVIAYKNPILQSEVKDIRGSTSYDHIHLLEDKGYIVREKYGRTYKIKLAEKFFEYFDVDGEKDIRALFKNVKKPDVSKVGDLEVYNANGEDNEFDSQIMERMKKLESSVNEVKEKDDFLNNFDEKLSLKKSLIDSAEKELDDLRPKVLENENGVFDDSDNSQLENDEESKKNDVDDNIDGDSNKDFSLDKINKQINEIAGDDSKEDTVESSSSDKDEFENDSEEDSDILDEATDADSKN
ncbi:SMC-Scp complex subunit ScpB [Candidatus Woesearchaeota archaeon]|nr:SMC-Scp complex subunit ScpB [Candidatus Woesearchaeota archaeon]